MVCLNPQGKRLLTLTPPVSALILVLAPLSAQSSCLKMLMTTVAYRQNEATSHKTRLAAAYLIAVQCVLRRPGGDGDCVGLAAAVALAVQILSVPADTGHVEFLTLLLRVRG